MKKNLYSHIVAIGILSIARQIAAEPIITFFLKPYPLQKEYSLIANGLQKPGGVAKQTLFGARPGMIDGILSSYFGFLNLSDNYGQIRFPRRHEEPAVTFLFTPRAIPVAMMSNTIHHWQIEQDSPAAQYRAERIQDETTKLYLWHIKQIDLPENRRIGLDTIILFVNPEHAYIPEGATLTTETPNLVLPPIYIKKGVKRTEKALKLLNLKHFFGPINELYEKNKDRYSTHIIH